MDIDAEIKEITAPVVVQQLAPTNEVAQDVNNSNAIIIQKSKALSLLAQYEGSSDSGEDDEDAAPVETYRKPESSSSSCSSDSEEEKDLKVIERKIRAPVESDGDTDDENTTKKKKREPLKVKGEMTLDDLPPIQDLQISVDERDCMEIGTITTVVDQLVLVEAFHNSVPLDIDSVLFLDHGKRALGKVFDVIGPVSTPIYCIRFNTHDDISSKGIAVGNKVFCAPRTEHSSFVILSQIMSKGSDASWKNDIEPPENFVDYSDDENERKTKRQAKSNRMQQNGGERREFAQGRAQGERREFTQGNRRPPNLAYPNYSWHQNLPVQPQPFMHQFQYQNYPQQ